MPPSRRTILRRGLFPASAGLTGCVTEQDDGAAPVTDDGTPTTTDEEMPTEIRLWFEEVPPPESEQDALVPIVFGDLSDGEQAIVQTALEEGEYTSEIGAESPALTELRRRISARTDGGVNAHLKRGDTYYRIGFVAGDHIIADPGH